MRRPAPRGSPAPAGRFRRSLPRRSREALVEAAIDRAHPAEPRRSSRRNAPSRAHRPTKSLGSAVGQRSCPGVHRFPAQDRAARRLLPPAVIGAMCGVLRRRRAPACPRVRVRRDVVRRAAFRSSPVAYRARRRARFLFIVIFGAKAGLDTGRSEDSRSRLRSRGDRDADEPAPLEFFNRLQTPPKKSSPLNLQAAIADRSWHRRGLPHRVKGLETPDDLARGSGRARQARTSCAATALAGIAEQIRTALGPRGAPTRSTRSPPRCACAAPVTFFLGRRRRDQHDARRRGDRRGDRRSRPSCRSR